jgi:hypothetical protein
MGKRWVPLESNPDVLNEFANAIGAPTTQYAFCDVLGMDEVSTHHTRQPPSRFLSPYHYACNSVIQASPAWEPLAAQLD